MKNSSLTHGLKLYHQWQLYLCVSVFQWDALLLNWTVANVWECAAPFCSCSVPIRDSWGFGTETLNALLFFMFTESLRRRDLEIPQLQYSLKSGLTLLVTWHKLNCSPHACAWKLGFQMWICFLERLFHVVSEDAVQFCVILMNDCQFCCACVFFVCLYLHSEFLEKSLAYLLFSVSLYTNLHTHYYPGWWNPDHKVCIVAAFSTNAHTHAYMLNWFTHIANMQTDLYEEHADTP